MLYAILFLLLRIPSLFEPYWYGDEGIYLALGQGIRQGLTLFEQIHDNKPPTLYYLAALSQTVFGFRLLLLLTMIPTIYFFNRLSKKFLSPRASKFSTLLFLILSSVPLIEGNIANAEVFMLLPTLLAFFVFFSSQKKIPLIISGFLLGFAFTIKVPVAVEFAFLCLWILLFSPQKIRKIITFVLSFITPTILYLIYFALKGALEPFLFAALFQNFGYISSWSTGSMQSPVTSGGLVIRGIFLLATWFLSFFLYQKKKIPKHLLFLSAWFFAALFGSLLSGRPYPHYLIQVLPPLCILLFFFNKAKYWIIAVVLLFLYSIYQYKFYFYPVFSYYQNFYSHLIGIKKNDDYRQFFGNEMPNIYKIADKIKSITGDKDRIFVWGDQSFIYPLSDRLAATKYIVSYHISDFNAYDLTLSQLEVLTPKVIVYYPMEHRPFPKLDEFISNYYSLTDQIGSAYIFELRQ